MPVEPAYLTLLRAGELQERVHQAWARLADCDLCPHHCHIDRRRTTKGAVCRTGECAVVASSGPHFGEERCLVGERGSGTIFFSCCNLRCEFCQNYDISQLEVAGLHRIEGRTIDCRSQSACFLY